MNESAADLPNLDALLAQSGWIRALARSLVRDDDGVDDVVQETWLVALAGGPRQGGSLRAWLAQVMRNVVRQRVRSDTRRRRREEKASRPESLPSTREIVERAAVHRRLVEAVWGLDEPYRTAVILRYFEDLPPREVAERLGVSVHTVHTRIDRARRRLRDVLDRRYGGRAAWALALFPASSLEAGAATAAGGGAAALAKGGLAVNLGAKIGAAAAVVVVAAATWLVTSPQEPSPETPPRTVAPGAAPPRPGPGGGEVTVAGEASSSRASAAGGSDVALLPDGFRGPFPRKYAVAGTVTDTAGEPIAGATVRTFRRYTSRADAVSTPEVIQVVTTDERGAYLVGPLESEVLVEAAHPGYHRVRAITFPWNEKNFVLGRAGRLAGRVTHERDATPSVGATVVAYSRTRRIAHYDGYPPLGWAEAVTGANGAYAFEDLPPGPFTIKVWPQDTIPLQLKEPTIVAGGAVTRCDVTLPHYRDVELRGRVTDRESGEPIQGAVVYLTNNDRQCGTTDRDGRYRIPGVFGWALVRIEADGYESHPSAVRVMPPLDAVMDIRLSRFASVSGKVVGPDGAPVADARIALSAESTREFNWRYLTRTQPDGIFVLPEVSPTGNRRVYAAADGFACAASERLDLDPGQAVADVVIRLGRGGVVTGRMSHHDGTPVEDVELRLDVDLRLVVQGQAPHFGPTATCRNGRYRFECVPAGRYRLVMKEPFRKLAEVEVREGETVHHDILLRDTGGRLAIHGRLVDPAGRSIEGLVVVARPADPKAPGGSGKSDAEGRFAITGLTAGRYRVYNTDSHYERREVEVQAGAHDVVLTLEKKPGITGRVIRADTGEAVTRFWYTFSDFTFFRPPVEDPEGRFTISGFWADRITKLEFGTEDGWITERRILFEKSDGKRCLPLVVRLVKGGVLIGTVETPAGRPAAGSSVQVFEATGSAAVLIAGVRTDAEGRIAIQPLRPGRYRIVATHPDWTRAEVTIRVRAEAEARVALRLDTAGGIRVQVFSPDGRPVRGAAVALEPDGGKPRPAFTDRSGRVHVSGLPAGDYMVRATHCDWAPASTRTTVYLGGDTPVALRLVEPGTIQLRVVDPEGRPVPAADVEVKDAVGREVRAIVDPAMQSYFEARRRRPDLSWASYRKTFLRTNDAGEHERQRLPTGTLTITVTKEGFVPATATVRVVPGGTTPVKIALKRR